MWTVILLASVGGALVGARSAPGQTTAPSTGISLRVGFDGVARPGAWTPLFVDVRTDRSEPAVLEVVNPLPRATQADVVSTPVSLAPIGTTTFTVYVRAGDPADWPIRVTLRDRHSGRTFAASERELVERPLVRAGFARLVGVSGRAGDAADAVAQLAAVPGTSAGSIAPRLLPDVPLAYECVDAVVLASADVNAIPADAQRALVDWTRRGGRLIVWLGSATPNEGSPLLDAMPASIGPIGADAIGRAARPLAPRAGARRATFGSVEGVVGRFGRGHVLVMGADPLVATAGADARSRADVWSRLFDAVAVPNDPVSASPSLAPASLAELDYNAARSAWFDIRTGLLIVVGGLVLLGPIDSGLMWLLGRRPAMAWWSTSAWALLVPAIVGLAFADADSTGERARAVRVTEEIDGQPIERRTWLSLATPRRIDVGVTATESAWWSAARGEPVPMGVAPDLPLLQTRGGQALAGPLRLGRSMGRVLESRQPLEGDASAVASVELEDDGDKRTIVNRGDRAWSRVRLVRGDRFWESTRAVNPGETLDVEPDGDAWRPLPPRREAVGFEQRMNVASRDADDVMAALSRGASSSELRVIAKSEDASIVETVPELRDASGSAYVRASFWIER